MKTEKQKMIAGEFYNALDPQLVKERQQARELLRALNDTFAGDEKLRAELINDLFEP